MLDIRRKLFTQKLVMPWHRLPRKAAGALSLEVSKVRLHGALPGQSELGGRYLPMTGELQLDKPQGPFQP